MVPTLKLGGFDLPKVPAMEGGPLAEVKSAVDVDLGGVVGAGLLSVFRVTLGDAGRWMWIEPDPALTARPSAPRGGVPLPGSVPSPLKPGQSDAPPPKPATNPPSGTRGTP
jgi:hypothetical protein